MAWPKGVPRSESTKAKTRKNLPVKEVISVYVNDKKSLSDVAKMFVCSTNTIRRLLLRNGIECRSPHEPIFTITKEFLLSEYVGKMKSGAQIAREIGCSDNTVLLYLHKYGIEVSKLGDRHPSKSPEFKRKMKKLYASGKHPLTRKDVRDKAISTKRSDSYREKASAQLSGKNNPQWRGGISFEPYCPKFNANFKRRVREFFDNRCLVCGKTHAENGQNMQVHHVKYNKNSCCDASIPMFAPLCKTCHPKTNHEREQWEYMLSYIIEEVYGGQSFLPKEAI